MTIENCCVVTSDRLGHKITDRIGPNRTRQHDRIHRRHAICAVRVFALGESVPSLAAVRAWIDARMDHLYVRRQGPPHYGNRSRWIERHSILLPGQPDAGYDPAGSWKTYTDDAMGNLLSVNEYGIATTTYTYNVLNQLTQVSMPRSNGTQTRTFSWSGPNLVSATNPENGTVTYAYNTVNQVTTRTDALQNQTKYTYDSYGRQTKVQHFKWNGTQLQEQTNQEWDFYYDTNPFNFSFSTNTWGRVAAVGFGGPNAPGTLNYQRDYYASAGRFWTPDPSGMAAVDPERSDKLEHVRLHQRRPH